MATPQEQQQLIALTTMMFNAPPGAEYLAELEAQFDGGASIGEIAAGLATTQQFNAQFAGMTGDTARINQVLSFVGIGEESPAYQEAFDFFQNGLNSGTNPGALQADAASFLNDTEDDDFSTAASIFKNKIDVGFTHSVTLGLGGTDITGLKQAVENVSESAASVANAKQVLEQLANNQDSDQEEEEGDTGGGTPEPSGPSFTVTVPNGEVKFGGTATGAVTLTTDGTNLTFTREDVEAATKPAISTIDPGGIPSVSMTADTHSTTGLAAKLAGDVTLTDAGTVTAGANATGYVLADVGGSQFTLGVADQNVTTGSSADTINVAAETATGRFTTVAADTIELSDTADIRGLANNAGTVGAALNANSLTLDAGRGSKVTMTAEQHGGFDAANITASDSADQIMLSNAGTVTGFAAVESYVLASGISTFTLGSAAQNVNASADGKDTIDLGTLSATGKFSTAATDTISLGNGADIKGVDNAGNVTGGALAANNLKLADDASVTMAAAQNNAFSGTIIAGAFETITISDTANADALKDIENYVLAGSGELTVTSGQETVNVDGQDDANETVNVAGLTVNGTYALGTGTDVLTADTGANISGVNEGSATTAEDLTLTSDAAVTMTAAQLGGFTNSISGDSVTVSLKDALSAADFDNITLPADATIELFDAANTLTTVDSLVSSGDTITIDGSDLTVGHALTFNGSAEIGGGFVVKGGADADELTGGDGADQLTGGAGNDTFFYERGSKVDDDDLSGLGLITDFEAGDNSAGGTIDKLVVETGFTPLAPSVLTEATVELNQSSILTEIATAFSGSSESGKTEVQIITGNENGDLAARSFLAVDIADDGNISSNDLVIEVTGITGTFDVNDISIT